MGWYEIRVQGRLGARWVNRFDGMTLTAGPEATTLISGPVADQAALHGVLRALGDLGLPLLALTEVRPDPSTTHEIHDTTRTGD